MAETITLTLVSHTNVGKTTLARTLLKRDIGEVRDAPHVTQVNEAHEMIRSNEGHVLRLWDTPGFGDSLRLQQRLAQTSNPIGWLLSQVWDRFTDRTFWFSQQIVRNIREDADVVLYLVNASESPQDAGYVEPEMRILQWIGKPVLVLLNQVGPPRPSIEELRETRHWVEHFSRFKVVRGVLLLDAFARCWVQEDRLLARVQSYLTGGKRDAFETLRAAWANNNREVFDESMRILSAHLIRAAQDKEAAPNPTVLNAMVAVGAVLGVSRNVQRELRQGESQAIDAMAVRLSEDIRASTDALIRLHGLTGESAPVVLERVASQVRAERRVDENKATLLGGVLMGALSGLVADIATGGLTFGGAAVSGAVAGAIGARLAAQGINRVRGTQTTTVAWNDAFLIDLLETAILRYLAIAHFGRGRGDYVESEFPAHWQETVIELLAERSEALRLLLEAAREDGEREALEAFLRDRCTAVLARLYPRDVVPAPEAAAPLAA